MSDRGQVSSYRVELGEEIPQSGYVWGLGVLVGDSEPMFVRDADYADRDAVVRAMSSITRNTQTAPVR
jgi:hypothetical protein